MIYGIATLRLRPGSFAAHAEAAKVNIAATRREEGCISYDLHQSVTDPDTYVFVERWASREALARHMEAPHLKIWRAIVMTIALERKFEIVEPANVEVR